jgi:hypothetical protein
MTSSLTTRRHTRRPAFRADMTWQALVHLARR